MMLNKIKVFVCLIVLVSFSSSAIPPVETGQLKVKITGLRKPQGNIMGSLFNSKEGFPGDASKAIKKTVVKIESGELVFYFKDIPFGTYAVGVMHDENNNKEMDTNFIGIPKEGFGVSNNAKGKFGPPSYDDAKFQFTKDGQEIAIKVTYM
jgi:uncharacterized protein (DUF2141 family)